MMLSYPRLTRSLALVEAERIRETLERGGISAVANLARVHHDRQQPVSTGRIATPAEIGQARARIIDDLSAWFSAGTISDKAAFDRQLGASLHAALRMVPSDAAHEGTWNFLTTIVLPDVLALRHPTLPDRRVIGGHPRNVLRKTWIRHEILGEELSTLGLSEDQLVGLFERTALVRNRRLAQLTAKRVAAQTGQRRDEWARKLYKLLTFQTGVLLLDALCDAALNQVVEDCAERADALRLLPPDLSAEED